METALRELVWKFGLANIHTALQSIVAETWADLQAIRGEPKKQAVVEPAPAPAPVAEPVEKKRRGRKAKAEPAPEAPAEAPKALPTKEEQASKKAVHQQVIQKKREELLSLQQNPIAMLTEKNMKEWIGQNMSYWLIAEQTGCFDYEVSNKAKEYNLKSPVSLMIAKKKKN